MEPIAPRVLSVASRIPSWSLSHHRICRAFRFISRKFGGTSRSVLTPDVSEEKRPLAGAKLARRRARRENFGNLILQVSPRLSESSPEILLVLSMSRSSAFFEQFKGSGKNDRMAGGEEKRGGEERGQKDEEVTMTGYKSRAIRVFIACPFFFYRCF